jgi:prolycopene isomerase
VLAAQWSYYGLPPEKLAFGYFSYPFIDYLKNGGYSIKGGSLELSKALVEVIEENGGKVLTSCPVTKIILDDKKRVCGVESRSTGRIDTKKIISNIPPKAVVSLAGEKFFDRGFLDNLNSLKTSVSGFQVYLGLNCTLESLGIDKDVYIKFHSPEVSQAEQYEHIDSGNIMSGVTGWSFNFFSNIDDTLVPEGKSSLGIFTLIGKDEWTTLSKPEYRKKKKELTDYLIDQATIQLPKLKDHIEVCEAGSPRTMKNFTWNPEGSIYGFEQTVKQSGLRERFQQKYPIKGLYQVGAWTFPGAGFIGTMLSAHTLVDRYFKSKLWSRK